MISIRTSTRLPKKPGAVAYFVFEDADHFRREISAIRKRHTLPGIPFRLRTFAAKPGQVLSLFPDLPPLVILVGLGRAADLSLEALRRASAAAARAASAAHMRSLVLHELDPEASRRLGRGREAQTLIALAIAEGFHLSLYRFDRYRSDRRRTRPTLSSVVFVASSAEHRAELTEGIRLARIICEGTLLARDLENAPGNELYPASLADRARRVGRSAGVRVRTLGERELRRLRMGGLLGVAQGSIRPPRFIIMDYNPRGRGTVVLVGKGVTFDSGGISIKPSASMAEMKMDMSGAAAVLATVVVAARLKLPTHVVGLLPATENLPSGSALKPGDILRHMNGKTSEIDNTDAEGRLILADALTYASRYAPDVVIDLATLTGACVVALGHFATGMMGNNEAMMSRLSESGERTYERVWPLPMFDEYDRLVKSEVADVKNTGGRWGGAIAAAMFLKKFIGPYRWVHLDIAGTAILEEDSDYIPRGGSGVGVRLLVDFLRHWKKP
jgi:leucyl aminopeptidase